MGRVVTIDGPAASGKSSVSRELARRLGWSWVSTGAFYRGLALAAAKLGVSADNESELAKLARSDRWSVRMTPDRTEVYFDNALVTDQIGQEEVGNIASKISHFPKVRQCLLENQRDCEATTQGLVAEGRDCGTVVFPQAEVKVYLTANQNLRAERRAKELGISVTETEKAQQQRDQQDSTRKTAPMQVPDNALVIDTSTLSFDEVVDQVETYVRAHL